MIDNTTTVIDQWDIADKTLAAAAVILARLIFVLLQYWLQNNRHYSVKSA